MPSWERLKREVSLARLIEGQSHRLTSQGKNLTEEFYYDNLNRLDCSTLNIAPQTSCAALTAGQKNLDVDYNQLGNITSKTGLGTYTYDAARTGHNASER